ncbi:MAG TPA: hypothetical protein VNJ01_09330 [Bacteriovoracaceae bacterium]|nr:hypothetical protein [Bacteriovoracaceae bacterium]
MKAFLIILVSVSVAFEVLQNPSGSVDFFQQHGLLFLIFISFFPRLTLLFSSVASGGLFWWLGLVFCPRVLVASLATVKYFDTNPVLVAIAWVVAVGGETMEKKGLSGKNKFFIRTMRTGPGYQHQSPEVARPEHSIKKDDAIEAEFTKKT